MSDLTEEQNLLLNALISRYVVLAEDSKALVEATENLPDVNGLHDIRNNVSVLIAQIDKLTAEVLLNGDLDNQTNP